MLRHAFFFAAFALFTLTNCRTAQKYVESGDYDGAVNHCVDKLEGRKKKSDELVRALELAFQKATEQDMRAADALAAEQQPANWDRINKIHRRIQARQARVYPLIPLTSDKGHTAKFMFVNIEKLELESRTNAAQYLYDKAAQKMELAQKGDKSAARAAHDLYGEIQQKYFADFKETGTLRKQAREMGIVYILFEIENTTPSLLPFRFEDRVLALQQSNLDTYWRRFHFEPEKGFTYDYKAFFRIDQIDVSPERVNERRFTEEQRVNDGWDYVYDAKGNVKKDSLGNDIKRKKVITVHADVIEVHQSKAARLGGYVDVVELATRKRTESRPITTEVIFENYAVSFVGDERALSEATKCRIGNRPVPFPMDSDLLLQAADRLNPMLSQELCACIAIR